MMNILVSDRKTPRGLKILPNTLQNDTFEQGNLPMLGLFGDKY
jgi:hypothetical protein